MCGVTGSHANTPHRAPDKRGNTLPHVGLLEQGGGHPRCDVAVELEKARDLRVSVGAPVRTYLPISEGESMR
eukprot:m.181018 g.181018  ORF g.181018 m.181018 type:complete len:72 (-) comp15375_c0_seq20:570-785(-)